MVMLTEDHVEMVHNPDYVFEWTEDGWPNLGMTIPRVFIERGYSGRVLSSITIPLGRGLTYYMIEGMPPLPVGSDGVFEDKLISIDHVLSSQ